MKRRALKLLGAWAGLLAVAFAAILFFSPVSEAQQPGHVTILATLRIGEFYRAYPRTAISVTMNGYITPTGTFQKLDSAGNVSVSGANLAVLPAGTIVTLVNVGSNTITLTETGTLNSAGNVALGANDSATFYSDGSDWWQTGSSNN